MLVRVILLRLVFESTLRTFHGRKCNALGGLVFIVEFPVACGVVVGGVEDGGDEERVVQNGWGSWATG